MESQSSCSHGFVECEFSDDGCHCHNRHIPATTHSAISSGVSQWLGFGWKSAPVRRCLNCRRSTGLMRYVSLVCPGALPGRGLFAGKEGRSLYRCRMNGPRCGSRTGLPPALCPWDAGTVRSIRTVVTQ